MSAQCSTIPERKIRNFRQSEKPVLSSISESLENTPKSAFKKKVLDSVFTPHRSLRLAKLSGNFSSLENLLDTLKPKEMKDKAALKGDFTPRRSSRLSKLSTEFSSAENLFDVRRPTLYGTPEGVLTTRVGLRSVSKGEAIKYLYNLQQLQEENQFIVERKAKLVDDQLREHYRLP